MHLQCKLVFLSSFSSVQKISLETLPPCISFKYLRKVRLEETPTHMQQVSDTGTSAIHLLDQRSKIFIIAFWSNLKLRKVLDENGNLQCPLHATECPSACSTSGSSPEQGKSHAASVSKLSWSFRGWSFFSHFYENKHSTAVSCYSYSLKLQRYMIKHFR